MAVQGLSHEMQVHIACITLYTHAVALHAQGILQKHERIYIHSYQRTDEPIVCCQTYGMTLQEQLMLCHIDGGRPVHALSAADTFNALFFPFQVHMLHTFSCIHAQDMCRVKPS